MILLMLVMVGMLFGWWTRTAECVWCPSYTCYGSCPSGCVCVTPPGQVGGKCYGIGVVPE